MTTRGLAYGVDLGTSNSAVRIVRPDGIRVWGRDPAATSATFSVPSSVRLATDGGIVVGHAAERGKLTNPARYRTDFKRDVGSSVPMLLGDLPVLRAELVGHVLTFLRERAIAAVDGEPELVVITVPASWEAGRRRLVRAAAAMAGFDPCRVHLETEPVAAAGGPLPDEPAHPMTCEHT